MKTQGRRRGFASYFVEPYRQVKLGLLVVILNLVFSALILGVFGYYVWEMYKAVSVYFAMTEQQSQLTFVKFGKPILIGVGLIVVFVITTIMVSVRYTHQIYGPLVSIHRYLDALLEGKHADPLHLRESDQLKELATKLNILGELATGGKRQSALVPIHRFLDDLLEGKTPQPLKMRDSDHLSALAEKLNRLTDKLRQS